MQDSQSPVTPRQEKELNEFADHFFRLLKEKHGPDDEVPVPPRRVRSRLVTPVIEKAASLTYQFAKERAAEICRKTLPSGGTQIQNFADWLYDTVVENYSFSNVLPSLFTSAIFVYEAVLFAKSRGYPNHYNYVADLWLQVFLRRFGNQLFRNGGWKALEQDSVRSARFYDRLLLKYPTGVFNIEELRQKTIQGISLYKYLYLESAANKSETRVTVSRRAMKRARNSNRTDDPLHSKKGFRRVTFSLDKLFAGNVTQIQSQIMRTPPELIQEGFPPVALPTEEFYRTLLISYNAGEISKKEVMREYEDFNREVKVPDELMGMELRELPGEREDSEESLDLDEVVSPRNNRKGSFVRKKLAKPKFGESVAEIMANFEKLKISLRSSTKVEADEDNAESATDVASNEEAKYSEEEKSGEGSDSSGDSTEEETKKQKSRKSGGKKKKNKRKSKKKKKKK